MKKKMTLMEILKNQTITTQFDFTGSCPDEENVIQTFTIFNTAFFLNEINHNFFSRVMFVDPENPFTDLVATFALWAANRGYMYARLAYAYSLGYNPIENYASVEQHTGSDMFINGKKLEHYYDANNPLKVTREYDSNNPLKVETSHTGDKIKTTYNNVTDKDTAYKFGVNSGEGVKSGINENVKSGNDELEYLGKKDDTTTGKYFDTTTGKYTDANSGTDTQTYNSTISKRGNIGVSTASGMISEMFAGLSQNLAARALYDFLDAFTFYDGEVFIW